MNYARTWYDCLEHARYWNVHYAYTFPGTLQCTGIIHYTLSPLYKCTAYKLTFVNTPCVSHLSDIGGDINYAYHISLYQTGLACTQA